MGRKKKVAAKATAAARFETRIERRMGDQNVTVNPAFFIMLFEMLAELFANCPEPSPEKLTRRMANAGPWARRRMIRETYEQGEGDLTKRQARAMVGAVIAEAKDNPKDTAAMVAEGRDERLRGTK